MSLSLQLGSLLASLLVACLLAKSCPLAGAATISSADGSTVAGSDGANTHLYRFITDAGSVVEIENRPFLPANFANARLLNLGSSSQNSRSLQTFPTSTSGSPGMSFMPSTSGMSPEHRIVTRGGVKQRFCGEMLVSALALVCKGNYRKRSLTSEIADCKYNFFLILILLSIIIF